MINASTPADYADALRELSPIQLATEHETAERAYVASVQAGHSALTLNIAGRRMELCAPWRLADDVPRSKGIDDG